MATERSEKSRALQKAAQNFVMLAKKYQPNLHTTEPKRKVDHDITDWYIFEKIDGVRARLHEDSLKTRTGKILPVPEDFMKQITSFCGDKSIQLDGELIHKNGVFSDTVSIVRADKNLKDWADIRYRIFDIVDDTKTFKERYTLLRELDRHSKKHSVRHQIKLLRDRGCIKDETSISSHLSKVVSAGGEGLILRNPDGLYKLGRSADLLKVKEFQDDEATVIDHYPGDGRHEGRLGGLVCKLNSGAQFRVGTGFSDEEREDPPEIGSTVTVRYFELSKDGVPRFPVYICIRNYE